MNRSLGYTLLEILVVLVIIAITASFAFLSISHYRERTAQAWVNNIIQTITLAEEFALLQPATLRMQFTPHTFYFSEYHGQWQRLDNDPELGTHPLPKELKITSNTTDIVISMNGTLTPFELFIGKQNHAPLYQISGHSDGSITSKRLGDS